MMRLSLPRSLMGRLHGSPSQLVVLALSTIGAIALATYSIIHLHPHPPVCLATDLGLLPASLTSRLPDTHDAFHSYTYRNHHQCNISSLDLHQPFHPLCQDRHSFLDAFSGGGRIGMNAPFQPRGCDMRWFTTEEACVILGRFERVIVVGDSMMRHLVGALNVLLRKDLGYGAVTNWNFNDEEL